jgi:hypothetical protein
MARPVTDLAHSPRANREGFSCPFPEVDVLLILGIVLLIISIAGGVIVHPILFVIAILALVAFFSHGRRSALR